MSAGCWVSTPVLSFCTSKSGVSVRKFALLNIKALDSAALGGQVIYFS
jgi:hypothetical protein